MPRQHQLSYQLVRVVVCMGVWSALANLGDTADTAYLTTLPEDPLQPVWNSLDAIPAQVLAGFREQLETLSRSTEASLSVVRTSLAELEATMKQKIDAIGEDVGDLVTDRLVNAEAVILEDINKLSESLTSVTQNCDIRALAGHSNITENREIREPTRCSHQAAAAAARVEEVVRRVDTATMRVEETIVKVEEAATRVEEIAARVEEVAKRVDEGAARVEEAAARVEEVAARVEEAAEHVEEAANKTQQLAITTTAGVNGAVSTRINTTSAHYLPRDCADIHWNQLEAPSGVYPTYPTLDPRTSVSAFCDMGVSGAKEAGGWTVVLRRHNTSWGLQNFNRSWAEYRVGFGRPGKGEWWYGLAPLHALTYRQPYEAAFLLHDLQRGIFIATYNTFRVESESRAFRLVVGGFSGNISHDALSAMHHGRPFSTYDRDNDGITNGSCAVNNGGGWWYDRCHRATLTATFPEGPDRTARTIRWYTPEDWLVLDDVTVKVRPTNYSHRFMEYTDDE